MKTRLSILARQLELKRTHKDDPIVQELVALIDRAYAAGVETGFRKYAWWKDGIQYVGSCGTTLEDALKEINQ